MLYIRRQLNPIGKIADHDADHDQRSRLIGYGSTLIPMTEACLLVVDSKKRMTPSRSALMKEFVNFAEAPRRAA